MTSFDPEPLIAALAEHEVEFIIIGGLAASLHGAAVLTFDLDILYERSFDNLTRLAATLQALNQLRRLEEQESGGVAASDEPPA